MAADDERARRSRRITPALRSGARRRPSGSGIPSATERSSDSLRPPSRPDIELEKVLGRGTSTSGIHPRPTPTTESIARSIDQLLEADMPTEAAEVMKLAGRHEEALALLLEHGLHHLVGACLRELGRPNEALPHLILTDPDGPHYREACREVARASLDLGYFEEYAIEYVKRFAESGPRSDRELGAFLDLAELYRGNGDPRHADRCLTGVLRLDPEHPAAQLMRLTWMAEAK